MAPYERRKYSQLLAEMEAAGLAEPRVAGLDALPCFDWYNNSCHLHAFTQGVLFVLIEAGLGGSCSSIPSLVGPSSAYTATCKLAQIT